MSYGFRACLNADPSTRVSSKRTGNRKVQKRRRRRRRRVPVGAEGVPCRVRAAPNRCLPPSLARVPSRLAPRASFRALSRRINDNNTALMGNQFASPRSEVQDGDVDGDVGRHAPAEGSPHERGSTPCSLLALVPVCSYLFKNTDIYVAGYLFSILEDDR